MVEWIRVVRAGSYLEDQGLALRLYRLTDLRPLFRRFTPEVFREASNKSRPFRSFFAFSKWIMKTFELLYLIEGQGAPQGDPKSRIIGFIGLYNVQAGQRLWLSIGIFDVRDRRRGYGTKALALLLDFLQRTAAVKTVHIEVQETNEPSLRLFRKLGFTVQQEDGETGLLRLHKILGLGTEG